MASGSFNVSTNNTYIDGTVKWSSTTNQANNTSTVTATLYLSRTNSGYTTSGSGTFAVAINGDNHPKTLSFNLTYNSNTNMASGSTVVTHNSDGKKSINISWDGSGGTVDVNASSGVAVLDTIPRESELTGGWSWTAGGSTTFTIDRKSSTFTHSIVVKISDGATTWHTLTTLTDVGTSVTWMPDSSDMQTIFDCLNNDTTSWNQSSSIDLITYNSSGTEIGRIEGYKGTVSSPAATYTTSSVSFNIGDALTVGFTRAYSTLIHTVKFYIGSTLIHTSPSGQTVSYVWTPTQTEIDNMYKAVTTAKTAVSKVEIYTYYNAATDQIVRSATSKTGTATVTNSLPVFSTIDYTDYNTTTSTLTGSNRGSNGKVYIIQNQSQLKAWVYNASKATPKNFATISKYIATLNGVSITANTPFATDIVFDFNKVNANIPQTLAIMVYDSRGFTTTVTMTVNMVAWSPPVINATALRQSGFLDATTLAVSGSISPVHVGSTDLNILDINASHYNYELAGAVIGSDRLFSRIVVTMPTYKADDTTITLANTSAWDVWVTIKDKFQSTSVKLTVGTGVPLIHIDSVMKSVGIGKFPIHNNSLEVEGDIYGAGDKLVSVIDTYGSNSNGTYIRYTNGIQICWYRTVDNTIAINNAYGSLFQNVKTWTYPAAFIAAPTVQCSEFRWGTGASWGTVGGTPLVASAVLRGIDSISRATGTDVNITAMAIGVWK